MSSAGSPISTSVICEEVFDDGFTPSNEEITDYAQKIGINPTKEPHLLYLAREGLLQALPSDWKICYNDQLHAHYYFNEKSKITQWDHPLDATYRELAEQARQRLNSTITDISDDVSQLDSGIKSLQGNELDLDSSSSQNLKMANLGQGNRFIESKLNSNNGAFGGALRSIKNSRFEVVRTNPQISLDMKIASNDSLNQKTFDMNTEKKGFQISGTGSMFLKSNTKKNVEENKKTVDGEKLMPPTKLFTESIQQNVKGILRDSSLTDVRRRSDENNAELFGNQDDKKSVRFNLDDIKMRSNNSPEDDPSSSRRFTQSPEISDNSDDDDDGDDDDPWDFMEEDDQNVGIEKHVKDVKVTPVVPKIAGGNPPNKITLKSTTNNNLDDLVAPKFSTNFNPFLNKPSDSIEKTGSTILDKIKERSLVRPLYEDTDSDSRASSVKSFLHKDIMESENRRKLDAMKSRLNEEFANEEKKLREEMRKNLEELKNNCIKENEIELNFFKSQLKSSKEEPTIFTESDAFQIENDKLQISYNNELQELKKLHEENVNDTKRQYEIQLNELKINLDKDNQKKLEDYRLGLEKQFETRRNQITIEHKKTMETLQINHAEILHDLERDLKSEEEILKKEHIIKLNDMRDKMTHELEIEKAKMRETGEDRLYEKIRCEKRLLEDKYRCLKEKYVRLKTDVKQSLEKRNRKREQQASAQQQSLTNTTTTTTGSETERSISNKPSIGNSDVKSASLSASYPVHHCKPPTINVPSASKSHHFHTKDRDKSVERHQSRKAGISSKYIKQLQTQHQDDTTSISQSDTTISNNYSKGKYLPTPFSDNGNSDSEALTRNQENNNNPRDRQRKKNFTRMKSASTSRLNTENYRADRPCTPVENLRRQLEKLEDLEDQFPDNTLDATYHLRYPFSDISNDHAGTSSELEFFKHRIHLERDSVRRAKESLRTQRTNFRARQREIKLRHKQTNSRHTLDQLIQEEKELTDMEVNLHRTRALLGEKVIRLRHLEQSLQRIYEKEKPIEMLKVENKDDATLSDLSSHSSSGFSSTDFGSDTNAHMNRRRELYQDSSEAIQNLEILNVEIREILDLLTKQQHYGSGTSFPQPDFNWTATALLSPNTQPVHHNLTAAMLQNQQAIPTLADRLETYRQLAAGRMQTQMNSLVSQNPRAVNYTTSLVERTKDLRNWLKQAKNEHETLFGANMNVLSGFSTGGGSAGGGGGGLNNIETIPGQQSNI